jgi:signal transduction histidine kinase/tetratricopeptide (TPR) repeat protein
LQWVALLAVAVVLPTVSLLWFMSQVVANERLVVRQKLAALYEDKLTDATARTETLFAEQLARLDQVKPDANPYAIFRRLVLEENFQGVVLWDGDGALVYPRPADVLGSGMPSGSPLAEAVQLEFAREDYAEAAQRYDRFRDDADPQVAVAAIVGKSRCLARLGRLDQAIEECRKAALAAPAEKGGPTLQVAIANARLLLLSLLKQSGQPQLHTGLLRQTLKALSGDLYRADSAKTAMPANQNLFVARKVLEAMQDSNQEVEGSELLKKLVAAEELSIAAAETFAPAAGRFDSYFQTELGGQLAYGLRRRTASATVLVLLSEEGMASALAGYHDVFADTAAACRIVSATGTVVAGAAEPKDKPFDTALLPDGFPGWKVELYFLGGEAFERTASRMIAVYIWIGVLVIALILIAGGFAMRAVGRQIRLNKMKNDFIATVSHELKTPLASMRVLVDTLLEGRVRDETQATEYLRLTAKENERLSRMIDNFLTFSRMERNKNAFTLADAVPAAMAQDAIEAVKTKFAKNNCHFTVEIAKDLPEIQADHDAVVTVLVNLLDNACKYTTDDKRIALAVFPEPGFVCFAVADNGIGLARRHFRKIFDSFYQVDSSLARKAEGCGLGLSIVKFIVDAHNGKIIVESKPGKGSKFTVRLPAGRSNGD